jgi:hypothetical protein
MSLESFGFYRFSSTEIYNTSYYTVIMSKFSYIIVQDEIFVGYFIVLMRVNLQQRSQ